MHKLAPYKTIETV